MDEEKRTLTDDDVKALVDELERRFERRFYLNLGRGVWGIAWKIIVSCIILIAAWGAFKGGKFF